MTPFRKPYFNLSQAICFGTNFNVQPMVNRYQVTILRERMSLNISGNSTTNETIVELVKKASNGKLYFTIDKLFICLSVSVVIGIGIVGNVSVLLIIKRTPSLQTAQNYLLANLAAADVTSLLFCSFSLIPMIRVLPDGAVGTVLCIFFVGFNVPLTATVVSVFTLTILAIERYNAIARPLRMLQVTGEMVRYAIISTWMASVTLNTPLFVYTNYKFKTAACLQTYSENAELTHIIFYIIFVFTLPFIVISFCYRKLVKAFNRRSAVTPDSNIPEKELMRQRKQLLKMSLTVTLVFGACVLPASVVTALRYFRLVSQTVRALGLLLLFVSSVVNPFIYAFHSSNYRRAFKTLLKCK